MKKELNRQYDIMIEEVERLKKEESRLPNGSIRTKQIRGGTYYYLQYRDGCHVKSKYIKAEELPEIRRNIEERKEIQNRIRELKDRIKKYESAMGIHRQYRPVRNVDYQDYSLFISTVAHDYKRLGMGAFIEKYDVTKYRGINKRYLKAYLDYINGIERGNSRRTNDLVLDPYTYQMYFKYGNKDVLKQELERAIPAFLNQGLLITSVQEAVNGAFDH